MHKIHVSNTSLPLLSSPGMGKELHGYITKYIKFSKFLTGLNSFIHSLDGEKKKEEIKEKKNYLKRATFHTALTQGKS